MTKNPFVRQHLIRDAIGRALYDAMKLDPSIYLFGEGAMIKQHYDAPQIERDFPDRVVTLPISEDANTNFAVGASLLGVKPVVDVITSDFLYRSFDSIANTAAKLNFVLPDGEPPRTIVIRSEFLLGGPTTGQRPEALFVHIPGLNIAIPSTPRDAYGLMWTALNMPEVTLFFEDRMIKDSETRPEDMDGVGKMAIPFGQASMRMRPPRPTLTIVTYGLMRQVVELVLEQEKIRTVDLIDLKTLYPIDWATLFDSTERTGNVLVVEPDVAYAGVGAEIAARITEEFLCRVVRLGAPRETIPASREGQARMLPSREQILEAIRGLV